MSKMEERMDFEALRISVATKQMSHEMGMSRVFPETFAFAILRAGPNTATRTIEQQGGDLELFCERCRAEWLRRGKPFTSRDALPYGAITFDESCSAMLKAADGYRDGCNAERIGPGHIMMGVVATTTAIRTALHEARVDLAQLVAAERKPTSAPRQPAAAGPVAAGQSCSKRRPQQDSLMAYCEDLTAKARERRLDPMIGREDELSRVIMTLNRRRKNNPLLVGSPGVGKTCIVEGLAQRIADGKVPPRLRGRNVLSLSMAALVAGTTYRGQFEERLEQIISAVREQGNIVLFIDEVHTVVGAGSAQGSLDAGNILKPALARGELSCIGATTEAEYKQVFQHDKAMDRRFQQIAVHEPTPEQTVEMLKGLRPSFEKHHACSISDDAIAAAVDLSVKHVSGRFLPDKAIDVIDEMGARFGGGGATLAGGHAAETVAAQAGLPLEAVISDDGERADRLERELRCLVAGQDQAVGAVVRAVRRAYSPLRDPCRPMASLLFVGPSSVGKSHLAGIIGEELCGGSIIKLNMAEYSEKHNVSRLFGAPPGYVGYGAPNQLTDRVARQPHSLVLLDNLDKAHEDVLHGIMEVLDTGVMTDGEGNEVNFRNCIIVMTSVVGAEQEAKTSLGFGDTGRSGQCMKDRLVDSCRRMFGEEFTNRIDELVPFIALDAAALKDVAVMAMAEVAERLARNGVTLRCDEDVHERLARTGGNARGVRTAVKNEIEPLLCAASFRNRVKQIRVRIRDGQYAVN